MKRPLFLLLVLVLTACGGSDGVDLNADEATTRLASDLDELTVATGIGAPGRTIGPDRQACLDDLQRDTGAVLVTTMWLYDRDAAADDLVDRARTHLLDAGYELATDTGDRVIGERGGFRVGARRVDAGFSLEATSPCVPTT